MSRFLLVKRKLSDCAMSQKVSAALSILRNSTDALNKKLAERELERRKAAQKDKRKGKAMESAKTKESTTKSSEQRLLHSSPHKHFLKGLNASNEVE